MSKLTQFNPPGYLSDFTPENAKRWSSEFVSPLMTREETLPQVTQFYNEVKSPHNGTEKPNPADIPWVAFPNTVTHNHPGNRDRWRTAEEEVGPDELGRPRTRWYQDEYCEWSVQRNAEGKVVRIAFTAEGPEYWQNLALWQPETVLKLYREHNPGFDIKKEDLFDGPGGNYNPHNKWNNRMDTGCIMHLAQRNNTLAAQFHLGGQSTVLRIDRDGRPIRDQDALLRCSRLGGAYRNSDPFIGIQINNLAHDRQGLLTIADPLGLYMHSFDFGSFNAPDGADVNQFWKWMRGTPADPANGRRSAHWVRGVFEVPKERNYVAGDITDNDGNNIEWGGQLADHIQIRLTGQFIRAGLHAARAYPCIDSLAAAQASVPKEGLVVEGCSNDRADGMDDKDWCCSGSAK